MNDQEISPSCLNHKEKLSHNGNLFIITAPSGAGKTTLCKAVLDRIPDMLYSVSYTTRKPRKGEQNEIDYYFITEDDFKNRIKNGKWAEWAKVYGNYYGTSSEFIDKGLASGSDILLDIDFQGTLQILDRYHDSITIFIMPPSLDILKLRLESRGTDSKHVISRRIEVANKEMENKDFYRHVVINDNLSVAVADLISIVEKYRTQVSHTSIQQKL
ncbi:MAG: guanylate kinase [Proteobacteria bacterium]|nr:guanylate kinase [Desulfobacteraceae bacterium]MBU2522195.1 guanylate kinase [Pseudomonadota bacterium]MBU3980800.1 guanylate kinase [Pseudomonadota bacterium]MBU4011878.1 guanylate kinase [Pseudomonadota bacterium]MBU4068089.1 guanylate kinase [Pseudomonadota bacterium]